MSVMQLKKKCCCTGACCLPDESCVEVTATECALLGGQFHGPGVPCGQVECVTNYFCVTNCNEPWPPSVHIFVLFDLLAAGCECPDPLTGFYLIDAILPQQCFQEMRYFGLVTVTNHLTCDGQALPDFQQNWMIDCALVPHQGQTCSPAILEPHFRIGPFIGANFIPYARSTQLLGQYQSSTVNFGECCPYTVIVG